MDLDQGGFGFQRVRTYLGPSLGWTDELVQPSSHITTGGIYQVLPGESLLLVDVAAAVQINLPDVTKWWQQTANQPATGFDRSITIKDLGGNAANFNIIVVPFGQQAIDDVQAAIVISVARSAVKLVPLLDLSGWAVALASVSGGGGGGGGDVFKAGNNTFTGTNIFQSTITVPTAATGDNSQNAASTAYVKAQGYLVSSALASYATLASPIFTGDPRAPTPSPGDNDTSIATTAFVQSTLAAGYQPLDADLTSLAGASGIGTMYYRSAAGTWSTVTIGGGITFSGGVLGSSAGGGNVSSVGTPTSGQLAQWTSSTQIQGVAISSLGFATIASPVFTGDPQAPTPATADNDTSIATTAYVKANLANYQPLDGDLTAIAALGGTNTIYYRSATDTWSPVSFSGLSFSGGILTVTVGGGNVNNVATPTVDQLAVWTDATHIKGTDVLAHDVTISKSNPFLRLTKAASGEVAYLASFNGANQRWAVSLGNATAETGGNAGSDFTIIAYNDAGTALATPIAITRSTGVVAIPNLAGYLSTSVTATTTVGYTFTPFNAGTISSGTFTPNPANGNYQYYTNNGAHTLAAPTVDCAVDLLITNGASAGAITASGFTYATGNFGDQVTTINGQRFIWSIRRINAIATFTIKALQ